MGAKHYICWLSARNITVDLTPCQGQVFEEMELTQKLMIFAAFMPVWCDGGDRHGRNVI